MGEAVNVQWAGDGKGWSGGASETWNNPSQASQSVSQRQTFQAQDAPSAAVLTQGCARPKQLEQ